MATTAATATAGDALEADALLAQVLALRGRLDALLQRGQPAASDSAQRRQVQHASDVNAGLAAAWASRAWDNGSRIAAAAAGAPHAAALEGVLEEACRRAPVARLPGVGAMRCRLPAPVLVDAGAAAAADDDVAGVETSWYNTPGGLHVVSTRTEAAAATTAAAVAGVAAEELAAAYPLPQDVTLAARDAAAAALAAWCAPSRHRAAALRVTTALIGNPRTCCCFICFFRITQRRAHTHSPPPPLSYRCRGVEHR